MAFEDAQRAVAFGRVIDAGHGVAGRDGFAVGWGLGEEFGINLGQFRYPAFYVGSIGIIACGLGPWVLDAEIGGGIRAGACGPLPAAVVRRDFPIQEVLHEKRFAVAPIDVEVLGEEHGGDHADAVVHEAGGEQFADAGIDDGEAGEALFPCVPVSARFVPWESAPVGIEFLMKDIGKMVEDGEVEFPPSEFLDVGIAADFTCRSGFFPDAQNICEDLADGDESEAKVLGNA